MSKRIYVGNLPWSVTYDRLKALFSSFGEIEQALVIANKFTGKSRGFGFVTFKDDKAADKAIAEMNNKDIEGRTLVVKEATPMGEREEGNKEDIKKEEKQQEKRPRKLRKSKEKIGEEKIKEEKAEEEMAIEG